MVSKSRKATLTEGSVGKTLIRLTVPMAVGVFSITAFSFANTFFIAQLGVEELVAISFTFPVVMVFGSIAMGVGTGTASVVSRAIGRGEETAVRRFTTDSLLLALLSVMALCVIGLLTIDQLFIALGAKTNTLPLIRQYMTIWYPGMLFIIVPMVGNHAIRATGDTKYPSLIMMVVAGVNVALDPLLIYGLAGFPRLELTGAAIATVIARALACIASLSILHFRERMLDFSMPRLADVLDSWRQVLWIGLPTALTNLLTPISMGIVTRLTAQFGQTAVAALGAGTRIVPLTMIPIHALGVAIMPFVGQNWGAGKADRVDEGRKRGYVFSIWWGCLCVATFWLLGPTVARIFSDDAEVVKQIVLFLHVIPLGFIIQGVFMLSSSTLNAINKPMVSASLVLIRMLVFFVPFAYIGAEIAGIAGIFVGVALTDYTSGALAYLWCGRVLAAESAHLKPLNRIDHGE